MSFDIADIKHRTLSDGSVLPLDTAKALLEKFRYHADADAYDWWDCVHNDFVDVMEAVGVSVESDSISTSDHGASFKASVCDWDKFLNDVGNTLAFQSPIVREHLKRHCTFRVAPYGRYGNIVLSDSSELPFPNTTWTTSECLCETEVSTGWCSCGYEEYQEFIEYYCPYDNPLQIAAWFQEMQKHTSDSVEAHFLCWFKDKASVLHRAVMDELDWLSSDEAVWDMVIANEWYRYDD